MTHDVPQTPLLQVKPSHWPVPVHLRGPHVEPLHRLPALHCVSMLQDVRQLPKLQM
jgi:hypothetical protein